MNTAQLLGGARIPIDELRRRLGKTAFHIWQVLLSVRDNTTGETRARVEYLAAPKGYSKTHPKAVERALARLRQSGLVVNLRTVHLFEDEGDPTRLTSKVVHRLIYGGLHDQRTAKIPGQVYASVKALPLHGGAGRGQGRRKNQNVPKQGIQQVAPPQPRLDSSAPGNQNGGSLQPQGEERISRPPVLISPEESKRGSGGNQNGGLILTPAREASCSPSENNGPLAREVNSSEAKAPPPAPAPSRPTPRSDLGSSLDDFVGPVAKRAPWTAPVPGEGGMPPYPGYSKLEPAVIPPPPRLNPKEPPSTHANVMLQAYQGVVKARTGKPCGVFHRGGLGASPHYPKLLEAAKLLLAEETPPASWAAWSVDTWFQKEMGKKSPPLNWVFDPERLQKHAGWYGSEGAAYLGGTVLWAESAKELLQRYAEMEAELRRVRATGSAVREVVSRYFPGNTYEEMIQQAKVERDAKQASLQAAANRGEWIW